VFRGVPVARRLVLVLLAAGALVATASAAAPPVGPLPAGPVAKISTKRGELVAVALPAPTNGRQWRQKGIVNPKVLKEVGEADVGPSIVIVFKAMGPGTATVAYGLTKGETARAYAGRRFVVTVS
jgi:hypothetical protein